MIVSPVNQNYFWVNGLFQSNLQNINAHAANIRNQEAELGGAEDEVMVTPMIVENGGGNNEWSKRAEIMDSSMGK